MSKKKTATKPAVATRRTFLAGVDPVKLCEFLEDHYTDTGGLDGSAYRRLYADSLAAFLEPDIEAVHFAKLLDSVDAACLVESAMRQAGFVVGFECCRQLLLGELEIPAAALKDGAE